LLFGSAVTTSTDSSNYIQLQILRQSQ
jgi:hypothetical protein